MKPDDISYSDLVREGKANLCVHFLPPSSLLEDEIPSYDDFFEQRRKLMALKIKTWFETL